MSERKIQILLVDDHHVLRDGLKALLETEKDIEVIGESSTGEKAVLLVRELNPDLVVMDLGLENMSGIEASKKILEENDEIKIVVLSMHVKREFVVKSLEAGCAGFVPKSTTHDSLLEAIRVVYGGENYLHPKAASALIQSITDEIDEKEKYDQLTEREQEVVRFTAMGYTSREIGEELIISPKTVDTYRHRAYEKLDINNRTDLIKFAMQVGILDELTE
jgi:two-component system response regulator NreC